MEVEGARALLVEDDHSWQQIISEMLTDAGLIVDLAADVTAALQWVRLQPHRLAIVDLSLVEDDPHNQDGLQILQALGNEDPACLKLLLTGFATVELAVKVLTDYSAYTCLRKETFNRGQFREIIQRALSNNQPNNLSHPQPEPSPAKTVELLTSNILIVEDDENWREILSGLMEEAHYSFRACGSYGEALGCLRREKFSLAVMDLSLGSETGSNAASSFDLEGYRLLARARSLDIPTLVVSGISDPNDIEKTYQEQDVFAFFEKHNFDRHAFLNTLQEALATSQARKKLEILTEREREVFLLLAQNKTNREIASTLFISTNTVKRHLKAIFEKLEIHTRSAAAAKASDAYSLPIGATYTSRPALPGSR